MVNDRAHSKLDREDVDMFTTKMLTPAAGEEDKPYTLRVWIPINPVAGEALDLNVRIEPRYPENSGAASLEMTPVAFLTDGTEDNLLDKAEFCKRRS